MERLCRDRCGEYVVLLRRDDDHDKWVCLNSTPVEGLMQDANVCWVVSGVYAYRPATLIDHLMMRREIGKEEANQMARQDFSWHTTHRCKEN